MAHAAKSGERSEYSVLAIEYVGELDNPVTPIILSDSKAGAEWYRDAVMRRSAPGLAYLHVVPVLLLETLASETQAHKGIPQSSETVSATIVTPKTRNVLLYDAASAIVLLDSLQERCKLQEALRLDLAHFENRIQVTQTPGPSSVMIANALYCMEVEGNPHEGSSGEQKRIYRVRYVYGAVDPNVDKPDELHLISYDSSGKSAWLYEVLVEDRNEKGYTLTWVNTARLREEKGEWVVEDALGGIYTYQRVHKVVERISRQQEQSISVQDVKPAGLVCRSD